MAKRTVVWTRTAAKQRREILKYWVNRNSSTKYAEKLIELIAERIKSIEGNPKLYRKADFPATHVSALGYFSIYYKYTGNSIIITAFWDNRQDPKKLLGLLK